MDMWVQCSTCKKLKPLYSFYYSKANRYVVRFNTTYECIECIIKASKKYNEANKRPKHKPIETGVMTCKRCGCIKNVKEFGKDTNYLKGRRKTCTVCVRIEKKKYYKQNKERLYKKYWDWLHREALYDSYTDKISCAHEIRRSPKNHKLLQVKCTYDQKWFNPTNSKVRNRIGSLEGYKSGEHNFYCSEECKNMCPIFHKIKWPEGYAPREDRSGQTEWAAAVFERSGGICEVEGCNEPAKVAHHIKPVKTHPLESMDIDNGIAVCKKHDKKFHDEPGMRYVDLAQTKMCITQDGKQIEI